MLDQGNEHQIEVYSDVKCTCRKHFEPIKITVKGVFLVSWKDMLTNLCWFFRGSV